MKMQQFTMTALSFLCFGALSAQSQTQSQTPPPNAPPPPGYGYYLPEGAGPYLRAGIGPSFWQDGNINNFGGPTSGKIEFRPGLAADAAIGYAFNNYIATDFEVGFVGAKMRDNIPGFSSDNSYLYNVPFLANVTLSAPIPHTNIIPYIGGGAGGADVVFDTDGFTDGSTVVVGREDDVVWAWQAFAGLKFQLTRNIFIGVGYKYFATEDSSFSYPPAPNFPVGFDGVQTHSVLATFELKF